MQEGQTKTASSDCATCQGELRPGPLWVGKEQDRKGPRRLPRRTLLTKISGRDQMRSWQAEMYELLSTEEEMPVAWPEAVLATCRRLPPCHRVQVTPAISPTPVPDLRRTLRPHDALGHRAAPQPDIPGRGAHPVSAASTNPLQPAKPRGS